MTLLPPWHDSNNHFLCKITVLWQNRLHMWRISSYLDYRWTKIVSEWRSHSPTQEDVLHFIMMFNFSNVLLNTFLCWDYYLYKVVQSILNELSIFSYSKWPPPILSPDLWLQCFLPPLPRGWDEPCFRCWALAWDLLNIICLIIDSTRKVISRFCLGRSILALWWLR